MRMFSISNVMGALVIGGLVGIGSAASGATILFQDTFDRPNNRDIDAVMTGITNNTGTVFGPSGVYTSPHVDPATDAPDFGTPDTNGANGGGQEILNNELRLKYNPGTANLFVNHNFINPSILSAGGFSVSVDLVANGGGVGTGTGAGFAIGMSAAEAASTGDALNGDMESSPSDFKMQDGLQQDGLNQASDVAVSDFRVVLRNDSFIQYGSDGHSLPFNQGPMMNQPGPAYLGGQNVGTNLGTLRGDFKFSDFNAGSTVQFELFVNDVSVGSGTFTWSETNQNYIGLDGRATNFIRVDDFTISIPEPSTIAVALFGIVAFGLRRRVSR